MEDNSAPVVKRVNSIVTLTLPSVDCYRDPTCLSPASSVSSRSCHSDASSYESGFSYNYDNSPQNSPWQSPCVSPKGSSSLQSCTLGASPRHSPSGSPRISITDDSWVGTRGSRPNSPCGGKRKYSFNGVPSHKYHLYSPNQSPGLSPQTSPRLSVTEDTWLPNTNQYTNSAIVDAINALTTDGLTDLGEGIPLKSRKTSLEHSCLDEPKSRTRWRRDRIPGALPGGLLLSTPALQKRDLQQWLLGCAPTPILVQAKALHQVGSMK